MAESYYAHISEDGRVHSLREHLEGTAKPGDCPRFTDEATRSRRIGTVPDETGEFGCGEWGWLAGLWHKPK